MDELNNLKEAWEELSKANVKKQYSAEELSKIVRKRSNNELLKIKHKLFLETGIGIFLSILLVVWISIINPADTLYAILFIVAILVISLLPYLKVFKAGITPGPNLRQHLTNFLESFDKLVDQYIRLATILMPVAGLGGFILGLRTTIGAEQWVSLLTLINVVLLILVILAISVSVLLFLRRYFNWIYGKNIKRLKECLSELEDVE